MRRTYEARPRLAADGCLELDIGAPPRPRVGRLFVVIALAAIGVALASCSSPGAVGPASGCDACDRAALEGGPQGGTGAAATGGQHASSAPGAYDIGAPNPVTTIGRGAGPTSASSNYQADKANAGALAVNQAWTADSEAIAEALKSAPASVLAAKALVDQLMVQAAAVVPGSPEHDKILDRIERTVRLTAELNREWVDGLAKFRPDFRGAVLLQTVLAGSAVNGRAVDPENARAAALGLPALTEAAARVKAAAGPPGDAPAPAVPALSPAGPPPADGTTPR